MYETWIRGAAVFTDVKIFVPKIKSINEDNIIRYTWISLHVVENKWLQGSLEIGLTSKHSFQGKI